MSRSIAWVCLIILSPLAIFCQPVSSVSASDFQKQISEKEVQLLDVRTASEYASGHIKNALQADWNNTEQFKQRMQYIDKSKPVYIYCLSGGRSTAAAQWMKNNGYSVIQLEGGINAWKKQSLPLETPAPVPQMSNSDYQALIPAKGLALVDFGAAWCPPCKQMEPVLSSLQSQMGSKLRMIKVDGGIHTDVMNTLHVDGIPAFILYKNGKEIWRKQGIVTIDEFKQAIAKG